MKQSTDKTYLFESMPVPKAIANLALPAVAVSLVTVLYSLADTWFVGMLDDPAEVAAVTLASPMMLAFYAINNLFGGGTSSVMGRALGRKDYETTRGCSAVGIWMTVLLALLYSAAYGLWKPFWLRLLGATGENVAITQAYLDWTVLLGAVPSILSVVMGYMVRTEGAAVHAAIGTMSGCILNIILDPIFVLPQFLGMGAEGAGCATFLSNCVACLYFLVLQFCKRKHSFITMSPRQARKGWRTLPAIFGVGIPGAIQNLLNVTGMTILNNFAAGYGITEAVAAIGIAYRIHMIPMQISFGVTGGIQPLLSYNYGSKNYTRAKKVTDTTLIFVETFLLLSCAAVFACAGPLIHGFSGVAGVISYGTVFLRVMIICIPFQCVDFLSVNVFQSFGNGRLALAFAVCRKVILEIPLLLLLNATVGLYGLPWAQTIAEMILCVVALVVLRRTFRTLISGTQEK